jgi:nucleoside permease NupC
MPPGRHEHHKEIKMTTISQKNFTQTASKFLDAIGELCAQAFLTAVLITIGLIVFVGLAGLLAAPLLTTISAFVEHGVSVGSIVIAVPCTIAQIAIVWTVWKAGGIQKAISFRK